MKIAENSFLTEMLENKIKKKKKKNKKILKKKKKKYF